MKKAVFKFFPPKKVQAYIMTADSSLVKKSNLIKLNKKTKKQQEEYDNELVGFPGALKLRSDEGPVSAQGMSSEVGGAGGIQTLAGYGNSSFGASPYGESVIKNTYGVEATKLFEQLSDVSTGEKFTQLVYG